MHFRRGRISSFHLLLLTALSGMLSACAPYAAPDVGGGGGNTSQKSESTYCTTRITYPTNVAVSGTGLFYYRPTDVSLGLSGNPVSAGIAFAEIQVTNASGAIVQCAETAADGTFSLHIPTGADTYTLSILSRSDNAAVKASVNEDYYDNQPYRISKNFSVTAGQTTATLGNVEAFARNNQSSKIEGGAFNILYQIWKANDYIRTATSNSSFVAPKVKIYWKKGFNPYTYFGGSSPLSFYRPSLRELFILGGTGGSVSNVDTDHFDNSVILHEYGHFLEDVYAKSDSPGGSHNGNFIIDPRLAWSEGWANFFQAAVLRQSTPTWRYYIDTTGFRNDSTEAGSGGISIKVELTIAGNTGECYTGTSIKCDPVSVSGEGTFREMSIARYLFKTIIAVVDGGANIPFRALWNAFSYSEVSGTPVGMASSQVRFRNIGRFNQFLSTIITNDHPTLATGWNTVVSGERQNTTSKDYSNVLVRQAENSCSTTALSPVVDANYPGGSARSNLLRSNDSYLYYFDGVTKTISLSYTGGGTNMDLDLFLYKDGHVYQEANQSENGTIVLRSARPYISENGNEAITLSGISAGYYLLNVKAYTLNKLSADLAGQTANYRLKVTQSGTTEDLCPAP